MRSAPTRLCLVSVPAIALAGLPQWAAAQATNPALSRTHLQRDAARGRLPRGSFINVPVQTVPALVKHVEDDPTVAARYARVFHMSPAAVVEAFRQLKVSEMPEDRVTRVYFVHGEKIGFRLLKVKKGTPIFEMPNGTPTLVLVCGNPLVPTPVPPLLAQPIPEFGPAFPELGPQVPPSVAISPLEAPGEMPALASPEAAAVETPGSAPGVPPGFIEDTEALPPGRLPRRELNLTPALALVLLAAFFGSSGGGGGVLGLVPVPSPVPGSGPVPPIPSPVPQSPPVGVPEPTPAVVALCGVLAYGAAALRRRERRGTRTHDRLVKRGRGAR